ncbi:hypothetical protein TNIN_465511 [Trichonephila inaurata madagascariensis]|uniref:Uncharacterized protein n=1 Tax=Trichonephila inaurata madagascariensis TaxID=2747483 RepID=A0A8X6MBR5_9ARAC|nr:hypothetical protein TNIN_465511 [Trichonephila inaurata madagascariensis]
MEQRLYFQLFIVPLTSGDMLIAFPTTRQAGWIALLSFTITMSHGAIRCNSSLASSQEKTDEGSVWTLFFRYSALVICGMAKKKKVKQA